MTNSTTIIASVSTALEQINYDGTAGHGDGAYKDQMFDNSGNPVSVGGNLFACPENTWGGHQSRTIRLNDGTIYNLRMTADGSFMTDGLNKQFYGKWKLRKRTGTNTWSDVASGYTWDDITLLRDPRDDTVYVTAFPSGVWTIFSSRDSDWGTGTPAGVAIGGNWDTVVTPANRHYGNTGIGYDGTIGFKASREVNYNQPVNQEDTSATRVELMTGKYNLGTSAWEWSPWQSKFIGLRHAYDIIIPNPSAKLPSGIYGVGQYDVHYDTAGYTLLSAGFYIWNGYKQYYMNPYDPTTYWERNENIKDPNAALQALTFNFRPDSCLMDQQGRFCGTYVVTGDGTGTKPNGFRFWCADAKTGKLIADIALPMHAGVTAGETHLHEDIHGNLWVLWAEPNNSTNSVVRILRIVESEAPRSAMWTTSTFTFTDNFSVLTSAFVDARTTNFLSIQAYAFNFISPRGGNARQDNKLGFVVSSRNTDYNGSTTYPSVNVTYTGVTSGTTLTVTGASSNNLVVGGPVYGSGVTTGTTIQSQSSGTTGGNGNYLLNNTLGIGSSTPMSSGPYNPFTLTGAQKLFYGEITFEH